MAKDQNKTVLYSSTMMGLTEKYRDNEILEPYLVVLSGPDQGKQFKLAHQENRFGRGVDVDIVIADPKISRHHGTFIILPDTIILEDNNSTNGTFIDGKPINKAKVELISRIQVGNTSLKIEYKNPHEADSDHALYQAANMDALTNILNRGAFMQRAQELIDASVRLDSDIAVVLCDVDHFKLKNDTYGHLAGDQILKSLAKVLSEHMRKGDLLARYGGEEFIMLLNTINQTESLAWAERIRKAVETYPFEFEGQFIPSTISIGVCCITAHKIESLVSVIQRADASLYEAKKHGRNRVVLNTL